MSTATQEADQSSAGGARVIVWEVLSYSSAVVVEREIQVRAVDYVFYDPPARIHDG